MAQGASLAAGAALASTAGGLLASPSHAASTPPPLDSAHMKEALRRFRARRRRVLTGRPSANQWEMEKVVDAEGSISTCSVPGTGLTVAVRSGDPATVLVHVIRRFHYEIDALGLQGEPRPVEGWVPPSGVHDSHLPESNQASGTAVAIRPGSYPPGIRGGFTTGQQLVIRDILADTEGVVRWGGDDRRPYEGLFYLTMRPGDPRLTQVAANIRTWDETPGLGAGVLVDPHEPQRQKAAKRLAAQQA